MRGVPRIVRAAIGTGLTFTIGVGAVAAAVGLVVVLVGQASVRDVLEMAGKLSVVAFLIGVAFSGMLAVTARSRRAAKLSIPRFAALGAGAGLLYFAFLAFNAAGRWSTADALANLVILPVLGGAAATGTLLLARRGRPGLESGEAARLLGEGGEVIGPHAFRGERQPPVR